MKIDRLFTAAFLGLTLCAMPLMMASPTALQADTLRVVKKGTNRALEVPMNRAVVVESDIPFAELSIANPGIADISSLSDRTIYVLGKSPGLTTLTLLDAGGQLITNVDVRVASDISEFKERLRQILPGEKIEVRTANDGIVMSGIVSSTQRLQRALDLAERYAPERVSNLMSVGGIQQVMLKVRFAEMQRSVSKSLSASLALDGLGAASRTLSGGTNTTTTAGAIANSLAGSTPASNTNAGAVLFGFNAGSTQVGLLLEALEQKGAVRFLAEPNLVALSGQEAKFLAGGEYPVPISQTDDRVTVEYKPFGVEMSFIPRVVDKDLINLELNAAVSAIDASNSVSLG
ncbi:MAG: pilus assembly protein CpaC, partial [Sulfitobacter sp.]